MSIRNSGLMTAATLADAFRRAKASGKKVSAVFPVHLTGQLVDMDALAEMANHGVALVEDACHALGSEDSRGGAVGACRLSTMACFSLHPVKVIAAGEGGLVTTNDDELAHRLRVARNHGMEREADRLVDRKLAFAVDGEVNPWYYEMVEPGFNYRLSDIHAALAASQLRKLDWFVARRKSLVALYDHLIAPLSPIAQPMARMSNAEIAWHLYVALIDFPALGRDRASMMRQLRNVGIGTQVHYIPLNRQPYYRNATVRLIFPGATVV